MFMQITPNKMQEPGEAIVEDLSNSVYVPELDLSDYQYPKLSLISEEFQSILKSFTLNCETYSFPVLLGNHNDLQILDLVNRPNMLIAGTTGSGKTQFIYNQIAFWLYSKHPAQLKFIFCGSKSIDYNLFAKLEKHFLAAIDKGTGIVSPERFPEAVSGLICEIQQRLHLFTLAGVKTLTQYNALIQKKQLDYRKGHYFMPDIAVIIDDLYNFSNTEELNSHLILVTQKNSYTGIYVLAATSQVNSPNISRQLRSNFILRVAFRLISQSDSKKVLDGIGAERIVDPGALLYNLNGQVIAAKQPYVEFEELKLIVEGISEQKAYPDSYRLFNPNREPEIDINNLDPLFEDAARLIVMHQQGSTSLIQRKMKLGYNRAGRVIDQLEAIGVVGPFEGSKAREVLIPDDFALEQFLDNMRESKFRYQKNIIESPKTKQDSIKVPVTSPEVLIEIPAKQKITSLPGSVADKPSFWDKMKKIF